ncbi:MAG: Do family serine endopeptidase [Verrucomicrobiota bacterium]
MKSLTSRAVYLAPFILGTAWTVAHLHSAQAIETAAGTGTPTEKTASGKASGEKSTSETSRALPELKVDNTPLPSSTPTYAPIVEKVSPSVVTIDTSQKVSRSDRSERGMGQGNHPLLDDPMFRRFFGLPEGADPQSPRGTPRKSPDRRNSENGNADRNENRGENRSEGSDRKREQTTPLGLGSGVIVSPDGYILTNNHVLEGADKIEVGIGNSPRKYTAKKVGGDPSTDIAVLKIDAKNLTPITFADSDQLRAGDIVIAVGNPFGLTRSATMGVVSAVGRKDRQMSQMADLSNFIQTDAAINMGNSGGALVDYQGRLVGINTAIFSRSGGNQGIGFSVPANMARGVMESLIKNGRVLRGFLGIGLQDLTEALEKKFNVEAGVGALVSEVQPGSPAEKSGVREYDVITSIDGKKVEGVQELRLRVAAMSPGAKVNLQVIRDGKPMEIAAVLGEKPDKGKGTAPVIAEDPDPDVMDGVTVSDLDDAARKEFNVPDKIKGALVTAVEPDSLAAGAGIRPGDVIQEVERKAIGSADQAVKMSEELKKEKQVLLKVYSKGASRFVVLESKP